MTTQKPESKEYFNNSDSSKGMAQRAESIKEWNKPELKIMNINLDTTFKVTGSVSDGYYVS